MKKLVLVLGMITCILGVSACGKTEKGQTEADQVSQFISDEEAVQAATGLIDSMEEICESNQTADYAEDAFASAALASWSSAREAMGNYVEVMDGSVEVDGSDAIINVTVKGELRNATVEIMLNKTEGWKSLSANPVYTFGEMMEKAALNTLLGMGTVFSVLILICIIISFFTLIPKIQNSFGKKESSYVKTEEKPPVVAKVVDNTIAQIIEKEEQVDNLELAAVIAAAIAASEGAVSTDGFVVRSIRKSKRAC